MTAEQRAAIDRAISEKRTPISQLQRARGIHATVLPFSSDWRYAGVLLEELVKGADRGAYGVSLDQSVKHAGLFFVSQYKAVTVGSECAQGSTLTEAIALAWAKQNGVEYDH